MTQPLASGADSIWMSRARPVVAGKIYMLQRRCAQRQFLMRPDAEVNNLFLYCLIRALNLNGLELIAVVMMSNHYHAVVRDVDGQLPAMLEHFHAQFARSLNCLRGRWENVWAAHEQTSCVELVSFDDVIAKSIYAYANPASAHLVEHIADWPGASSWRAMFAKQRVLNAKRPQFYFSESAPKEVKVRLQLPQLKNDDGAAFVARVKRGVRELEDRVRVQRRQPDAHVRSVMGPHRVLRQRWDARPHSVEPRRKLSPRVACRSKWHRVEAIARNRSWLAAYLQARLAWLAGAAVPFPPGTWRAERYAIARALAPPAAACM